MSLDKHELQKKLELFLQLDNLEFAGANFVSAVPELSSSEAIELLNKMVDPSSRRCSNDVQDHIDFLKWSNQEDPKMAEMRITGKLNERFNELDDPYEKLNMMRRRASGASGLPKYKP